MNLQNSRNSNLARTNFQMGFIIGMKLLHNLTYKNHLVLALIQFILHCKTSIDKIFRRDWTIRGYEIKSELMLLLGRGLSISLIVCEGTYGKGRGRLKPFLLKNTSINSIKITEHLNICTFHKFIISCLAMTITSDLITKHKSVCKYFELYLNSEQVIQRCFGRLHFWHFQETPKKTSLVESSFRKLYASNFF